METTIDGAGRVVVPKAIRERLGLTAGTRLTLRLRDGLVEMAPAPAPLRLEHRGGGLVATSDEPLPPLGVEQVRDAIEQQRR